ncbi:MAG: tRNA (guanosine(37)-N1)-methyltransferase TrmD [Deltaproteobacteria bacterium]|nr:tRNA (guanosine(37)-N1)-methyltransferase TrmD [Deltaproteobacteria bacterium]
MDFCVLTLFPEMFSGFFSAGVVGRAAENGLIALSAVNIRDFAEGRHKVTDDRPFGGGSGMVMKPEPLAGAIAAARQAHPGCRVALLSPTGRPFTQEVAREYAGLGSLALVCGRYEGVDERVLSLVDEELSLGDFVLSGGEPAAMVVVDAVARLVPGVLGNTESTGEESFENGILEYPHYTRPREYKGDTVPEVLLSGNHQAVAAWRTKAALLRTLANRPDLLEGRNLGREERKLLGRWKKEIDRILSAQPVPGACAPPGDEPQRG